MSMINVMEFRDAATRWASLRNAQFKYNWVVKGGWEGWIQVDIISYILSVNSTIEILREQPIYRNARKKTDLLLNADHREKEQIPVEIKAQSFENRNNFITDVEDDLEKLDEERTADFAYSTCIMMGLTFNPPSLHQLKNIRRDDHPIFKEIFTGEIAICLAISSRAGEWWNPENDIAGFLMQ